MDQDNKNNEEIDLSNRLTDSGVGVKPEEEYAVDYLNHRGAPKIIQWVIKYSGGFIKNEKQASFVLIIFAALAIIIALFLFFSGGNSTKITAPPGSKITYPPNEPPRLEQPLK